jgi:ABC-type nitrate/sulfonate/bicarbonate transport system substrate-binding protein
MIGISTEGAYTEGVAARKESGINTPADLKGKRIGYFKGSTAQYGLMMALRQQGIRLDQVTLLDMPPAEQLAALANKEIDAAMVWEPWMQRMVHEANAKIIATEGDFGIYTNVTGYAARRDWLRDNKETAVRFLRALLTAYDVLQKDPSIGVRTLAGEMGIKEAWVKEIYRDAPPPNMYWSTDRGYRYSLVEGSGLQRRLGYLATFLLEEKVISKEVDVSEALDVSVITEALRTSKTQ